MMKKQTVRTSTEQTDNVKYTANWYKTKYGSKSSKSRATHGVAEKPSYVSRGLSVKADSQKLQGWLGGGGTVIRKTMVAGPATSAICLSRFRNKYLT